ncbi:MAG: zinc-binding alcohol dehydrogenase family protein [Acidimicrobiales bacterium]|nr:zinc-binding alcohol dehydrogenase family protein [Acidimicrobiales bacterium]
MKAAVYYRNGPPEVLQYEDVPDPVCGPGMVVIQIEAISIEGGDTLNRLGGALTADPHIVGSKSAGTIIEVGDGVVDRVVGDRVVATFMNGSHAERIAVPYQVTWQIPEGADLVPCACVPVAFGTAHDCLFEFGRLQKGETVLIQAGAGGVGMAAIQLAHRAGATTIATASSLDRLKPLLDLGLDHAVDYSKDNWVDEVRGLTDGRGVNLVVDSVGGATLQKSLACLGYRGRAVTVGNAGRDFTPVDVGGLMMNNQSLTGVFLGAEMATPRAQQMVQDLVNEVAAGTLTVLVDRTFPLAEAAAAHAFIESRQAIGRVVLIP